MTAPTTHADPPAPRDAPGHGYPDTPAFRGFFAPSRIEADVYDLEVDGEIPHELYGAFYRAAADTQFPPRSGHDIYINGDGMMTMIRFGQGHADLRTRYVRTQRFQRERAARLLALKEAALAYELDPLTLQTRGVFSFDGQLPGRTFTAHPKIDPLTGEMIAFSYNSSGRPDRDINLFVISPAGQVTRTETFQAPYSSMVHDWLVTREHMIITFSPMISDWERMKEEPQYFVWDPPQGTHVAVIPRAEGVAGIRWFASELVMETHSLNAWSAGDTVIADHFVARSGWFSQFPMTTQGPLREAPPFAHRWTLDVTKGAAHWADSDATYTSEPLFDHPGDMPRVDPRSLMQRNRHSWIGCMNPAAGPMPEFGPMGPPFNSLFHRDDDTGAVTGYYVGEDSAPEEPVFVPTGPDAAEGEGYLLALVGRRALNRDDMIILDALDVAAGPVATIKIPFRLRYGFHGTWVPGEDLDRT